MKKTVDALGKVCPVPGIKAEQAAKELGGAGEVEVFVDNKTAVENLKKLAAQKGFEASSENMASGIYRVSLEVSEEAYQKLQLSEESAAVCETAEAGEKKTVVVISSDKMGEGSDELGKVLIKGFIFAISEQEKLPDTILFYNGGAKLTCNGSDSLDDIRSLEEAGVKVMTCGTCLNHYGLTEELAVGTVTNMYVIAETMTSADLIVKP